MIGIYGHDEESATKTIADNGDLITQVNLPKI